MGTAAYGILVGLFGGIGLFFLVLAWRRGRVVSIELFVGLFSVAAAGSTLATLRMHSSTNVEEYEAILHGSFSYFGIAALVAITWTVGLRTGLGYPRVPQALTGVGLIAVALNALGPGALIVDDVTGLREVGLFGETFVVHTPGPSSLQPVLLGFLVAITVYVLLALAIRLRRGGPNLDALMIGITVAWLLNLYDVLVDEGVVDTSYLAPFGLVPFVVGLAIEHVNNIMTTERRLINQSTTLETVVAERTAALHAAHHDLMKQLDNQNNSALRLAKLSDMFLLLSSVSAADDDLDEVLGEALAFLGAIVDAADAQITWQPSSSVGDGRVKRIEWKKRGTEAAADQEREVIDRALESGDVVVGRLTVACDGGRRFPDEYRRLVDLTAQYLGGLLLRLRLESSRLNLAVDHERQRIARELHDSLSQRLYAAAFNAEAVSLAARGDAESAAEGAAKIRMLVLSTLAEMRTLLFDLQPEVLNKQSFPDLVAQLCASVAEIYQQPVDLFVVHDKPGVPTKPKLALYRIVQESLGNALRHADATKVGVTIDVDVDGVTIQVADDGIGFDPSAPGTGHGLRNIRQRAAEIGATLDLTSRAGAGTEVSVTWPRHAVDRSLEQAHVPGLEVVD